MKCKTCEREFTPPRKKNLKLSYVYHFKKAKNQPEEESIKEESDSEHNNDEEVKVVNKMRVKKNIEHKQLIKNNFQVVK